MLLCRLDVDLAATFTFALPLALPSTTPNF